MHTEYITSHNAPHLQLLPNAEWFTEGGVTPEGKWWIAPTSLFIEQIVTAILVVSSLSFH